MLAHSTQTSLASALISLVALQIGCSSSSTVPLAVPSAELVSQAGVITLRDDHGRNTPITADSKLRFTLRDGSSSSRVRASELCRTQVGFALRNETGCADPRPFVAFDDIVSVDVSTWDRAGTTAIIAAGVVVVVGAIVYIAVSSSDKKKSKDDDASGSSSSHRSTRNAGTGGQMIAPALRVGDAMAQTAAYEEAVSRPRIGTGALFGTADRRRATVQVLLDTDISASFFAPRDSFATGGRLGVRLWSFFDVSAGARVLTGEGRPTRPTPVLGLGFHGPLPRARWLAIAVGGEVGATSAIEFYGTARLGVRAAPFSGFWLSLYPLHPTYTSWNGGFGDRWVAASTFEMAYAF